MNPLLVCKDLTCGYRSKPVLKDVSLEIRAGESIAVLGPNGAGKTCLLKTISGELKPLMGSVSISESGQLVDLHSLAAERAARLLAVVPQDEPTSFAFTARELVTMGRLAFGSGIFDSPDDLRQADEALKIADCWDLADRPVTELSGGERQRVLIARALAQDTPLVMLDEPTSHLDPAHQVAVAKLINRLMEAGKGVLTVVHDLTLAPRIAKRAILVARGRIMIDASVDTVLESDFLENAYSVQFTRLRSPSGDLIVVPYAS